MTYDEALFEVNKRLRFGSKLGLERISLFLEKLGNPQKKLKFIHVAGTNGKGTTCTYMASILKEAGYKVGLYTSPYVVDFRERFQINFDMIPKEELIEQIEKISPIAEEIEKTGEDITEFEFITALAFNWFYEKNCHIVVLEVGLGGRFDGTNVIDKPEAAVIASISLDHTGILGDTVEKIAFEKAGIVKNNSKVIMYPQQNLKALKVFENVCTERNAQLIIPDTKAITIVNSNLLGTDFLFENKAYHINFMGAHQVLNAVNAITAIKNIDFNVTDEAISLGLENAFIPARMEILSKAPLFILDGGHNPECAQALKNVVLNHLDGKKITAIIGMVADKDSKNYLAEVAPLFSKIITVTPHNPRALPAEELQRLALDYCPDVIVAKSSEEAVKLALKSETIIACGSFYMAGEIRETFKEIVEK